MAVTAGTRDLARPESEIRCTGACMHCCILPLSKQRLPTMPAPLKALLRLLLRQLSSVLLDERPPIPGLLISMYAAIRNHAYRS